MTQLNEDLARVNKTIAKINELADEKYLLDEACVHHSQMNMILSFGSMMGFDIAVGRREVKEYDDQALLALIKNRTAAQLHVCSAKIADMIANLGGTQ